MQRKVYHYGASRLQHAMDFLEYFGGIFFGVKMLKDLGGKNSRHAICFQGNIRSVYLKIMNIASINVTLGILKLVFGDIQSRDRVKSLG